MWLLPLFAAQDHAAKELRGMEAQFFLLDLVPGKIMLLHGQVTALVAVSVELQALIGLEVREEMLNKGKGQVESDAPTVIGAVGLGIEQFLFVAHHQTNQIVDIQAVSQPQATS